MKELAEYPHCDSNVLHQKNSCQYCDMYPERQKQREKDKINFTGKTDPDKALCPSDASRGIAGAHVWGGNYPNSYPPIGTLEYFSDGQMHECTSFYEASVPQPRLSLWSRLKTYILK